MFHNIAPFLVIRGAANIGLVSWLHVDLIGMFGALSGSINVLVGVSGLYMLLSTYTTLLKKVTVPIALYEPTPPSSASWAGFFCCPRFRQ